MTQKIILAVTFSVLLSTLSFGQKVGGDRDVHGCIGSAGYTYSAIKDSCVRVWMEKIKLQGMTPETKGFIAALIFSKDKKKAEVLMPKGAAMLTRKGKSNKYVLVKEKLELTVSNGYYLKKSGKALFSLDGLEN